MTKYKHFKKLLQTVHQDVSLDTILQFRDKNSDVLWSDIIYPETGDSILHVSARLGQTDIVSYIIQKWAPKNVNIKNNDCKTPLHEAAQFSQPEIVKILLENGADVDAIKRADWTPLMLACTKSGEKSLEVISLLLNSSASCVLKNKDGWSPLHLACRTGDVNIVKKLLEYETKVVDSRTNNGRNLLHIACLHGNIDIVKLLFDYNVQVNVKDKCGNTPLIDAVSSNSQDLVLFLINKGANINDCNNTGLGCLHIAAGSGLSGMIQFLIKDLHMNPNVLTSTNVAPLHCAARNKQMQALEILKQLGADTNIKDVHNRTADDYLKL